MGESMLKPTFIMKFCPKCKKRTPMMLCQVGNKTDPTTIKCAVCETEWVVDENFNLVHMEYVEHNDKIDWKRALERMKKQTV